MATLSFPLVANDAAAAGHLTYYPLRAVSHALFAAAASAASSLPPASPVSLFGGSPHGQGASLRDMPASRPLLAPGVSARLLGDPCAWRNHFGVACVPTTEEEEEVGRGSGRRFQGMVSTYRPSTLPPPLYTPRVNTVLGYLKPAPSIKYRREIVSTAECDLTLDWALPADNIEALRSVGRAPLVSLRTANPSHSNNNMSHRCSGGSRKFMLLLPGAANTSTSAAYIASMASHALAAGFEGVGILNARGMITPLTSSCLPWHHGVTSDVRAVAYNVFSEQGLQDRFGGSINGSSPIRSVAVGFSMGGATLANFLAEEGEQLAQLKGNESRSQHHHPSSPIKSTYKSATPSVAHHQHSKSATTSLVAAACVMSPWKMQRADDAMAASVVGQACRTQILHSMRDYLAQNRHIVEAPHQEAKKAQEGTARPIFPINWERTLNATTLRDVTEGCFAPMLGYADAEEYYAHVDCFDKLPKIRLPTLCVSAEDDPLVGPAMPHEDWLDVIEASGNAVSYAEFNSVGHVATLDSPLSEFVNAPNIIEGFVLRAMQARCCEWYRRKVNRTSSSSTKTALTRELTPFPPSAPQGCSLS